MITKKNLILLTLISAIVLTIIIAAGLPSLELHPGEWGRASKGNVPETIENDALEALRGIVKSPGSLVIALFVIIVIYCVRSPKAILRLGILFCVVMGLYLLKDYITFDNLFINNPNAPAKIAEQMKDLPDGARLKPDPPGWLVAVFSLFISGLILTVSFFLWRRFRPKTSTLEVVAQEAKKAMEELEHGTDIKEGVIRCYYEMIKAVKRELDLNRQHSMTTREFEQAMEGIGIKGDNVRRLTRLFEKVRYGAKDLDTHEEQEAIDCLDSIIKDCERLR